MQSNVGMNHTALVSWNRRKAPFVEQNYSREHVWQFDGGTVVPASASPFLIPPHLSRVDAVDPEEAFVAALSSCHMLWFLSLASKEGHVVESYSDSASGHLQLDADGRGRITKVTLQPQVEFSGVSVSQVALMALHERAHSMCFLAASVKCEVVVEPISAPRIPQLTGNDDETVF
jgi:organic hydroperoxide reductase OsmC/OhrA